tara:strand:- start:2361 stop:2636 length:276 start_codon:yes stop_codon:yes gene_type:complete
MRPILTQVSSIVTNGCAHYSLVSSKLDAIYTAVGAGVGVLFIFFDIPNTISIVVLAASLVMARMYRKRVLTEVYQSDEMESDSSPLALTAK